MASPVESLKPAFITFHICVDVVNKKHSAFCGISDVGIFNLVHSGVRGAQGFQLCFTLWWSRLLHQCFGPKVVRKRVTAAPLQFITLLTHLGQRSALRTEASPSFGQTGGGCAHELRYR
jgi:hypothetical protein